MIDPDRIQQIHDRIRIAADGLTLEFTDDGAHAMGDIVWLLGRIAQMRTLDDVDADFASYKARVIALAKGILPPKETTTMFLEALEELQLGEDE